MSRETSETAWQPIETAPKDWTWVLLAFEGDTAPTTAYWSPVSGIWKPWGDDDLGEFVPTHWMKLPPLPGAAHGA